MVIDKHNACLYNNQAAEDRQSSRCQKTRANFFSISHLLLNSSLSSSVNRCLKMVDSQYYLPNDIGISALDCGEAFRLLSPQEKMYAHYLSRSAWYVTYLYTLQVEVNTIDILTNQ